MTTHSVVSNQEWLAARKSLLEKEKEFTRLRDELSAQRRELPWACVEKDYVFQDTDGDKSLADLFDGRSQLIVYHFMFGPDWETGCKSCSFWADTYNGIIVHLNQRDVSMAAISRTSIEKITGFKKRMGWNFHWLSSLNNTFNYDYRASFSPEEMAADTLDYNYKMTTFPVSEAPGMSVFYKNGDGSIFHTYSCYSRGLDMLNSTYHHLDIVPKGRDEEHLSYPMEWIKLKDEY